MRAETVLKAPEPHQASSELSNALAGGPWLAWLSTELLERLPGGLVRPLPVDIGRYRYRSGFVARRSAEDLPPFRALEQTVRDTALGRDGPPSG